MRTWCDNALEKGWKNTREACKHSATPRVLYAFVVFSQHSPHAQWRSEATSNHYVIAVKCPDVYMSTSSANRRHSDQMSITQLL